MHEAIRQLKQDLIQLFFYNVAVGKRDVMFADYCFSGIGSLDRIGFGGGSFKNVLLFYLACFFCLLL